MQLIAHDLQKSIMKKRLGDKIGNEAGLQSFLDNPVVGIQVPGNQYDRVRYAGFLQYLLRKIKAVNVRESCVKDDEIEGRCFKVLQGGATAVRCGYVKRIRSQEPLQAPAHVCVVIDYQDAFLVMWG